MPGSARVEGHFTECHQFEGVDTNGFASLGGFGGGDGGGAELGDIVVTAKATDKQQTSLPVGDPGFLICNLQWPVCQRWSTEKFCADARERQEYYGNFAGPAAGGSTFAAEALKKKAPAKGFGLLAAIYAAGAVEAAIDLRRWCNG